MADATPPLRWGQRLAQALAIGLALAWVGLGAWHLRKDLPDGLRVDSPPTVVPGDAIQLLVDTTTADAYGRPILEQQIFDETLQLVRGARRFIVLDQFLFNSHDGAPGEIVNASAPRRPLTRELTQALIDARRARPELRVLLITDPINDLYGGDPSEALAALRLAGVEVVNTDLDVLRDSNPVYSGLWRLAVRWWSRPTAGGGWLPHPLEPDSSRVSFDAWTRLLNFKANHRKVIIADDGRGDIVGMVGSANPHDASSAHSNLALRVRGAALRPLFESEIRIARFSGWLGVPILLPARTADPSARSPGAASRAQPAEVRVLTEGAIRDALLTRLAITRRGDRIDAALFYLADRDIIDALMAASGRGVEIRLILDPNRDAFGRTRTGIPNRPAASELVARTDGAIKVRWYRTHGEQFHAKAVAITSGDRAWLTLGSANLTRRNIGDFNLEADLSVEGPRTIPALADFDRWFNRLWNNRAPAGVEFTADFGSFADPSQTRYWAYRIMETTGLSTF